METRPPTLTRILVAIGFALSCFALALFLWIAFGGPLPLNPEGYRFTVPFKEATQLAVQSDVRISGVSVGKVESINLNDKGQADASIQVDSQYAPIPADTRAILRQKTLLGETYVELTPGNRDGPKLPEGGSIPEGQVSQAVQLDEIFRTFNARTRQAFRVWMTGTAAALHNQGANLSAAIAELDPFAEQTNRVLKILNDQQPAVRGLVRSGGDVFNALSERKGQLRGLIQNSNTVFQTTAQRNADLEQLFEILPTFQRESRATLERLNTFAANTDPLVRQLVPAAKQLSPTLIAAGKAAPDLQKFFVGLRGSINAAPTGFPALRDLLSNDLTPLLTRLGANSDGHSAFLAQFNSIAQGLRDYKHEITAFFANSAAATEGQQPIGATGFGRQVKVLRTTSPLGPESLATFSNRLISNRGNPYFKPLGYNKVKTGLEAFANTPCGAGLNATLPPRSQVASDPNFSAHTDVAGPDAGNLYDRIKTYALSGKTQISNVPAPFKGQCIKQGKFNSIGKNSERTNYLHVRPQP